MFICGMVLRSAVILKPGLILHGPVTADLATNVVHSYDKLRNDCSLTLDVRIL